MPWLNTRVSSSGSSTTAPTRIGTPTAAAAPLIRSWASALRYGSMSDAFSGHSTKSGCAWLPAATSSARPRVCWTWLSSTSRRRALKSIPGSATLPWTRPTCRVAGPPSVCGCGGDRQHRRHNPQPRRDRRPAGASPHRAGRRAGAVRARAWPGQRRTGPPGTSARGRRRPTPRAAARELSWLNPMRSQPHPPNGNRPLTASTRTQTHGTHSQRQTQPGDAAPSPPPPPRSTAPCTGSVRSRRPVRSPA